MKFLQIKDSKSIFIVLLFTILNLIIHSSYSQKHLEYLKKTKDFNEIVRLTEEYYKDKDKGEESGYTQFKVWEYFHRTRLDAYGKVINTTEKGLKEFNKYKSIQKESRYKTAAISQSNWTSLGPQTGSNPASMGRVSCIAMDPADSNIIYVGSASGGLWRSMNRGSTWACITDGFPVLLAISGIAIDPSSPIGNRRIYIVTGDGDNLLFAGLGVLKSEDNGTTWFQTQNLNNNNNDEYGHKLLMHPTNPKILFAATEAGIYKTIDGGVTWSLKLTDRGGVGDIEFKPGAPNTMYAGTWRGIFKSIDLGETWTVVSTGLPNPFTFSRIALAVTPANPNYVYALYGYYDDNDNPYGMYRSTDSGNSFTLRTSEDIVYGQGGYNLVLEASPFNAEEVYGGGVLLSKSVDGGFSWHGFMSGEFHVDNHALQFFNKTLYVGNDGGIQYFSLKDGQWKDLSKGLVITQVYKIGGDPNSNKILNGTQDNGSNKLIDKVNINWAGGDGMECYVNPKNSNIFYGSYQGGDFLKSEDDGITYRGIGEGSYDQYRQWVTPFAMDPNNPDILYAGYEDLFRYNNLLSTWTNVTNGKIGLWDSSEVCNHICVAPSNSNYIYVVKWEGLYKSKDSGNTWVSLFPKKQYDINYCVVHPTNPDIIFITKNDIFDVGNKVFKSIDGGITWINLTGTLPYVTVNCIEYQKGSNNGLYLGTDQGIYYRDDDLGDWILFNQGIPYTSVTELEIHYASQKIRAATYGRGVWESPIYGANVKPTVTITSPTNGQSLAAPASVAINATTTGTVTKVEFYQGDQKLGEDLTSPYSFTWSNIPGGVYTISAKAINSTDTIASTNKATINITGGITCVSAGSITRDFWANILGAEVYKIPVNTTPTSTSSLTIFEGPRNVADHYGSRIRGYVCPPLTGAYTFWIASDDQCELWLSTDENPANKKKIAYHTGWNFFREWEKYPTQKSVAIILTAGKRYYIEALQKEHELDDHVSVGWQIPGGIQERPIPGNRVSPFTITNNPPTVALTSPGNNSTFVVPATFTITANASDSDGSITKVEFYQGSTLLGTDVSSPYNFNWSNVPIGTYYITAIAYDNSNNKTVSAYITVVVNPSNGVPTVSLTSPANNASFNAPATITINANASDPGGAVTKVEFYQGNTLIGTDLTSPYSINWTNVPVGTYYITAVAYDNSGLKGTSSFITINVQSNTNTCTASGTILREFWNGVAGTAVSTVPVNLPPTSSSQVSLFEGPSNVGSNYAARYRGYICIPVTGNYIFWISSNDASELWLSTNDAPANKVKIAFVTSYTGIRQWDKYSTQKSTTISLVAGQRYYIEALHKQGTGTDNLAVGWQLPNGTQERPIPGNRLSPYTGAISLDNVEIIKLSAARDTSALPIDITMYPNPTQKGNITLAVEGYEQTKHKVYISIANQSGSVVYSDKVSCDITCRRTIINIDDKFQPGIYIINVTIDKKVYSERLLVE